MPLAIPILTAVLAATIGILSTTINPILSEDVLRQTNILKFQPDKFQGGKKHERYFEGWYYKFVSAPIRSSLQSDYFAVENGTSFSMAVVPGIFYSDSSVEGESHAFVFVTLNGQQQHYYRFNVDQFKYATVNEEYYIQVGNNRFTKDGVSLNLSPQSLDDASLILRGNLTFTNPSPWPVSLLNLGAMGSVGWMPGLECTHGILSFDHELSGNLTLSIISNESMKINDTTSYYESSLEISMDRGRGYTEKDFGRSFPSLWVWIQTNSFRNNPGTSLFVSIARIPTPFFGLEFPGFTAAIWHKGELIPFATWSGAAFDDIRLSKDEVYIAMRSARHGGRSKYRVEISVDRRNVPEVLLYAPVDFSRMEPFVWEALRASVHLRMFDDKGNVIIDDIGDYAGLEVHGNVQYLVDNLCGKKTANKLICL